MTKAQLAKAIRDQEPGLLPPDDDEMIADPTTCGECGGDLLGDLDAAIASATDIEHWHTMVETAISGHHCA